MHNNVNPNNRMSRLSLLLMVFGGEDREGSWGKGNPLCSRERGFPFPQTPIPSPSALYSGG